LIQVYALQGGKYVPGFPLEQTPALVKEPGGAVWIVLDRPAAAEVEQIAKLFHLHPLEVEDCMQDVELPKLDEFEDHAYVITHGLRMDEHGEVHKVELDSFIGQSWLISSHLVESRSVRLMREKVERNPEILGRGVDFLLHAILDAQVDNFMPIVDRFDAEIDRLEEEILERPREALLGEILQLRRQIANMRRSMVPQRDVIGRLARHDLPYISGKCSIYFRDVYDHVVRVHEMLEALRDVVGGLTESYRSMISQRLNEVMQRLTLISTIFLPMTFIASIYGMNFHHESSRFNMPELDWPLGYPFALLLMLTVGGGFFLYFKKQDWI
jgi:magnesium transporter